MHQALYRSESFSLTCRVMREEIPPGVLFARQPIYDAELRLAGYELLFRPYDGGVINPATLDGTLATSQVLINAFTGTDLARVCERQSAWINFTTEALQQDLPFDGRNVVIEILEDVAPSPEVIKALLHLRKRGFRLALDDYSLPDADHPLLGYVDIVKIDYPRYSEEAFSRLVAALRAYNPALVLLAEKIETRVDHTRAQRAGCTLFQGYFLSRPEPVYGSAIPVSRLNTIRLLADLNTNGLSVRDMSTTVQRDPFLSLRLIRLANSAWAGPSRPITTLQGAVMTLGLARIRSLASLLLLARLDDKPHALQRLAMLRGHFCHLLGEFLPGQSGDMAFTVGLFSCLDSFLDQPLEEVVRIIPVHPEVHRALIERQGGLGEILQAAIDYQYGRWDAIDWPALATLGLSPADVAEAYRQALLLSASEGELESQSPP